jgi:P-aminobenzoate N-oxygenase AurF
MPVDAPHRGTIHRRSLDGLAARRDSQKTGAAEFDFATPIDRTRWFVCPTLTPLYYAPIYNRLESLHQRRYNQITALSFSELIGFFETTFAASVLVALAAARRGALDRELSECLDGFIAEERQHTEWWRQLNRLSEPDLYAQSDRTIIRLPAAAKWLLRQLTKHPHQFPFVFWVMLALEERSLEISRRCMRMPAEEIEPRYLAIYRTHMAHEVRHVQIDWHLIDRFYARRPAAVRRWNAKLFRAAVRRFFLPPTRSAWRAVQRLAGEFPELASVRSAMKRQLRDVGRDPNYHEMMYSRESTPVTFSLFDRFPEFHSMSRVLHSYRPQPFREGMSP